MKRGFYIGVFVVIALFTLVFASNTVTSGDLTLNWTQTGNISFTPTQFAPDISILQDSTLNFSASVSNQSIVLTDSNITCNLNLSTEPSLLEMSYDSGFTYSHQFTEAIRLANYSVICNTSTSSIESDSVSFSVFPNYLPSPRFVVENESVIPFELIPQTVYVELINLSSESSEITDFAEYCLATVNGTEYNLTSETFGDDTYYTNSSVIFPKSGNESVTLSCINGEDLYEWNWTIDVKEYASDFSEVQTDFGNSHNSSGKVNIILKNDLMIFSNDESGANYFTLFTNSEGIFSLNNTNPDSSLNLKSVFSLISSSLLLNFGAEGDGGKSSIHSIFDQSDATILDSNFSSVTFPFLTTFDTNNNGRFESLSFYLVDPESGLKKDLLIYSNGSSLDTNLGSFYSGTACHEDFNTDGYIDVLVSGVGTGRQTSIFLNNGSDFNLTHTLTNGLIYGSCHISKFLENNQSNIIILGNKSASELDLYLYETYQDFLNENDVSATRLPNISGLYNSDIFVADFDNDGLKDIIMCGLNASDSPRTYYLKQNQSNPGYFYEQTGVFPHANVSSCSISASHLDNNSGLDIAIGGLGATDDDKKIKVYLNTPPQIKPNPQAPNITNVSYNLTNKTLYIEWDETHPIHSYNLKVSYNNGTAIMTGFYPISTHPAQGYLGNMRYRTNFTLQNVEHSMVTVGVQSFDEALRKSVWSEESRTCNPPTDSTTWNIDSYCTYTNATLSGYNITITENGTLELTNSSLTSTNTNITVNGKLSGTNLSVNSMYYNSTQHLSDITISGNLTITSNITVTDVTASNVFISGNVTLLDSTIEPTILSGGYAEKKVTTSFTYKDQFDNSLTTVTQNVTGTQSTNMSHILTHTIYEFGSNQSFTYQTLFNKSGYYNRTQTITPNTSIKITLNKYPLPSMSGFDLDITTNFTTANITGDETTDKTFFSNVSNFTIGKSSIGKIAYLEPVNLSYRNLSQVIKITNNSIYVNDSGLNKRANITFFNLSYEEVPLIYKDGSLCQNCSNISYDGENVSVIVDGFSNYTTTANAVLTYEAPSIIIKDTNYTFSVKYVNATNTSQAITNASCVLNASGDIFNLSLNGSFYQNQTNFTSVGTIAISVTCDEEDFENLSMTQSARVVADGKYFLLSESYDSLDKSSSGFNEQLYYHGYSGTFFKEYFGTTLESESFVDFQSQPAIPTPFSLTDLNNIGNVTKVTLGEDTPLSSYSTGTFTTADLDDDGDMDIIYCGDNKFLTFENRFNNNNHNPSTFVPHPFSDYAVETCSLAYTVHNNTKYVAVQGQHDSNATLFLLKVNSATNITLLNETEGLNNGELVFIDLNRDNLLDIVNTGFNAEKEDARVNIFTINDSKLQLSDLNISKDIYFSSVAQLILPNETYPTILISGSYFNATEKTRIQAYQFNGTHLQTRNELIEDVPAFSKGSMIFADITNNSYPELFISGSQNTQLFTLFDTENTPAEIPNTPNITKATYENNQLYIEWNTTNENVTFHLRVGEKAKPDRFISSIVSTSTNPTQGQQGNMFDRRNFTLKSAPDTCYFIQVKAISGAYIGGNWSDVIRTNDRNTEKFDLTQYYDSNCDGIYKSTPPPSSGLDTNSGGNTGTTSAGSATLVSSETPSESPNQDNTQDTTNTEQPQPDEPTPSSSNDEPEYTEQKTINKLIQSLTANSLRHTQIIQYTGTQTIVQEEIKNIGLFPQDFKLYITIPKEIVELATDIDSKTKFDIIEMDPEIQFNATNIGSYESFNIQYTFPSRVSEELLQQITYDIIPENPDEQDYKDVETQINNTKLALNVTQSSETKDNKTIYTIDLNLDDQAKLTNVSIYQEIPKCLLEIINEQVAESDVDFEVVEADPLIVWHFDELLSDQKIQLAINAVADEACTDQAVSVALAKQIVYAQSNIDLYRVIFTLLFIPLFALLLIIADVFTRPEKHEKKEINYLITYIKTHLHKGIPLWEIKQFLLTKGHPVDDVEEACKFNSKNKLNKHFQHFNISIHEFLLAFLILLNILDFAEILPGDIDYFKKILSWVILGYLLHRISITSLLLGKKLPNVDLLLIFSFFAMTLKNLVGFAKTAIDEVRLVQDLYTFIWRHNQVFEVYFFLAGLAGILLATILISREEARAPSLINSIVKHQNYIKRFIFTHALLLIFFISVFNLMFEWLAIAVDAFILITTMVAVIFLAIKHHKRFKPAELLEEMAEDAEKVYEKVLNLFHYEKYLPLAFSAMLILYVLTEIANYLIPYLTGVYDIIYFGNFGRDHMPLFSIKHFLDESASLFAQQVAHLPPVDASLVFVAYLLNVIAMLYLLILPARYWWNHYQQREKPIAEKSHFLLRPGELSLFVASIIVFFVRPVFEITTLRTYDIIGGGNTLVGVDILTKPLILDMLPAVLLIALSTGLLFYFLELKWNKATSDVVLLASFGFFTYYVYLFFLTQKDYYLETITSLILTQPIIAIYFVLFAAFTFFFIYILGYAMIAYLYMPSGLQHYVFSLKSMKSFLKHQHLHHVEHVNHSSDKVKSVEEYVKKSLDSGHELFRIVEHLEEKGYELDFIEEIIHDVIPDNKLIEGFDHFKHYHHNKELLHALHRYIKQEYKKRDLKDIIDEVLAKRYTVKDAVAGLQRLHTLHRSNGELRAELAKDPLKVKEVLKKHPSPEGTIIATLKTFDTIPADELTIHLVHRLHRKFHKVKDIITHTEKFRFGEEDIRIALQHITAKNDFDEEIMKYV